MRPTERTISTGRLRSRPFVRIWSFPEELDRDDRFTDSAKLTPHSRLPPVEFGTRIAAWGEAVKEPQSGGCPTHRPTHGFLSFLMYCEATRSRPSDHEAVHFGHLTLRRWFPACRLRSFGVDGVRQCGSSGRHASLTSTGRFCPAIWRIWPTSPTPASPALRRNLRFGAKTAVSQTRRPTLHRRSSGAWLRRLASGRPRSPTMTGPAGPCVGIAAQSSTSSRSRPSTRPSRPGFGGGFPTTCCRASWRQRLWRRRSAVGLRANGSSGLAHIGSIASCIRPKPRATMQHCSGWPTASTPPPGRLNALLADDGEGAAFSRLAADPGRVGLESLLAEIDKLELLRALSLPPGLLRGYHPDQAKRFRRRATVENAWELRRHPERIRLALLAFYCVPRQGEVVDGLVELLIQVTHRITVKAERRVVEELVEEAREVRGKGRHPVPGSRGHCWSTGGRGAPGHLPCRRRADLRGAGPRSPGTGNPAEPARPYCGARLVWLLLPSDDAPAARGIGVPLQQWRT